MKFHKVRLIDQLYSYVSLPKDSVFEGPERSGTGDIGIGKGSFPSPDIDHFREIAVTVKSVLLHEYPGQPNSYATGRKKGIGFMENRIRYHSGAPWEEVAGYARAVRAGNTIEVSGTVARENGAVIGPCDARIQTLKILEIIEHAIAQLGGKRSDIVRTRMYVVNIQRDWEAVGKAHGEFFSGIHPATSMVEVSSLISPEYLVEIEATAILSPDLKA